MPDDLDVDVITYLQGKNVRVSRGGAHDVQVPCMFHGGNPNEKGNLWISVDPSSYALWFCHVCGEKGNLRTLMRHYGDELSPKREVDDRSLQIFEAATKLYESLMTTEGLSYLRNRRGLMPSTIAKHRWGWAPGGLALTNHLRSLGFKYGEMTKTGLVTDVGGQMHDFFNCELTFVYAVAGSVVLLRGKKIDGKYRTPPGAESRLFNTDGTFSADEICIAEGEVDAMVAEQFGYVTVGVPGAKMWKPAWTDYFVDAKRVWVCYDNDEAGRSGSSDVVKILGPKAKQVILPDAGDLSDWYMENRAGRDEFAALLKVSLEKGSLLLSSRQAWEKWQALQGVGGLRLGYELLDKTIAPGVLPGQVIVTLASTGTGKTISALNILHRVVLMKPDARVLFFSLEQTAAEWFERSMRIWNFYNLTCPVEDVPHETAEWWDDHIMVVEKNRISLEEMITAIYEYEERMDGRPDLIVVDYLGYFSHAFKGEATERTTQAIMMLKAVAKDMGVAMLVPSQLSRATTMGQEPGLDSGRDTGAIENTADFVLTIWSDDTAAGRHPSDHTGLIMARLGKSRHGGRGLLMPLQFGYMSLTLVPQDDPMARLCRDELQYRQQGGCTWQDAIKRHRLGHPQFLGGYRPKVMEIGGGVG